MTQKALSEKKPVVDRKLPAAQIFSPRLAHRKKPSMWTKTTSVPPPSREATTQQPAPKFLLQNDLDERTRINSSLLDNVVSLDRQRKDLANSNGKFKSF